VCVCVCVCVCVRVCACAVESLAFGGPPLVMDFCVSATLIVFTPAPLIAACWQLACWRARALAQALTPVQGLPSSINSVCTHTTGGPVGKDNELCAHTQKKHTQTGRPVGQRRQ